MTISTNASFAQITVNNTSVDQTIEKLVDYATTIDEKTPRPDRLELEKTTKLMFLSSLITGDRGEDGSIEAND